MREERGAQQGESESDPREELELRGASGVSKNLVRFQKRKKRKKKSKEKKAGKKLRAGGCIQPGGMKVTLPGRR